MLTGILARWAAGTLLAGAAILAVSGCTQNLQQDHGFDQLRMLARSQKALSSREQRAAMVKNLRADVLAAAAMADTPALEKALSVIGALPREKFVSSAGRKAAYVDLPQQIGYAQTISDPYVVAIMTAALDLPPDANVLDVGTGSGYQAAVLARLARRVSSIEIVPQLALSAAARLRRLSFLNVEVRSGDGFMGWPDHAPYDGIIVAASATSVPVPLLDQLKPGGRLVMPIGAAETSTQVLRITKRADGTFDQCSLGGALFVPLTGSHVLPFARYGLLDRSIPLCFGRPIIWLL
jgi:protein-L-isoaspartate(D-aspartate) O-methyltransferase